MDYNKILDDIKNKLIQEKACNNDFFNYNSSHSLEVVVEDLTSLVLTLNYGYIYFNVEEKKHGLVLTYNKFNTKLIKMTETRMTFDNYGSLIDKMVNVIIYNSKKHSYKR